ncbi:MAG TPA: lytic murein transglycosylase [Solirubrobacteraceae bacterium]|nr:lytic murein transglycosylase [Solirubrobacteraceae bacterium]
MTRGAPTMLDVPVKDDSSAPRRRRRLCAGALAAALLLVSLPATTAQAEPGVHGEVAAPEEAQTPDGTTTTTTVPGSTAPVSPEAEQGQEEGQPTPPTTTSAPTTAPAPPGAQTTATPEVQAQTAQPATGQPAAATSHGGEHATSQHRGAGRGKPKAKADDAPAKGTAEHLRLGRSAPLPSTLTPALPGALGSPIGGIPDFFIESFDIPPFLLPIYQAAGAAYGIPWQVLAAINQVETDYGRDLAVSSAGAEGWMQFLPSSWAQYGVDVNGDGYEDPYNPADAIFAAARYLAAAGGAGDIRGAIYSYNHSQAYVDSVMLRAQLLDGTPPELLDALTGLTESRFPVHAAAHFADGFPTVPGEPSGGSRTIPGTIIYAAAGSPVIAAQDGRIVAIGQSPALGRYISLRDAYGNTYTYAELGSVAELYPVLEPRVKARHAAAHAAARGLGPRPSGPASAGVQPHSPLSEAASTSELALGAAAGLEAKPEPAVPAAPAAAPSATHLTAAPHSFRAGSEEVHLHVLHRGVEVLAGTVLGHLGSPAESGGAVPPTPAGGPPAAAEAHMLFQIRPAGVGAPLIDPKPLLDGWVALENTSIYRARGANPFRAGSPSAGQALLASKRQLEQLLLSEPAVRFAASCDRGDVRAGQVDRRVLAALEFLAVSGLRPTVSFPGCRLDAGARNSNGETVDISAIDGVPIAGHEGPGSLADIAIRRLLRLQGTVRPRELATGSLSYTGTAGTLTLPADRGLIHLTYAAPVRGGAHAASVQGTPLTPQQWLQLTARLGEIPNPSVSHEPSSAAIPDPSPASAAAPAAGTGGE